MQKAAGWPLSHALVEMAGIEPASERLNPRISTSVARLCSRRRPEVWQNRQSASRWDPKALFRPERGMPVGTRGFLAPASTTGQGAGWADVTSRGGHAANSLTYAARGIAA